MDIQPGIVNFPRLFVVALWVSLWRIGAAVVQVTAPAGPCRGSSSKA
jgi:hypothetical protein